MCQSTTSTHLLKIIPYTFAGSYDPTTQMSDTWLVIGNVSRTIYSGKKLNIYYVWMV